MAGGTGTRMGHKLPKQYIEVKGKPVIHYTLVPMLKSHLFTEVIICAEAEWHQFILDHLPEINPQIKIEFSKPGETRQFTVFNALKLIHEKYPDCDVVVIHDAARPLASEDLLARCLESLKGVDGVLPVIKVKDTIYQSCDGRHVDSLLDRSALYAGQSPEAFRFPQYYKAHIDSTKEELLKINGSSELALIKGLTVDMIEGEENNFKITTPEDLERFKQILEEKNDC